MNDMTQALELAFTKLGELATKYGPPAVETAAMVIRVNSIGSLAIGAVELIAVGGCAAALNWTLRAGFAAYNTYKAARYAGYDGFLHQIAGVPILACALAAGIDGTGRLLNVWNWVAIWNPKLALAAKLVNALPGIGQ